MGDMMDKVSRLRSLFPDLDIEVDGGVGTGNIEQVAKVLYMYCVTVDHECILMSHCSVFSGCSLIIAVC